MLHSQHQGHYWSALLPYCHIKLNHGRFFSFIELSIFGSNFFVCLFVCLFVFSFVLSKNFFFHFEEGENHRHYWCYLYVFLIVVEENLNLLRRHRHYWLLFVMILLLFLLVLCFQFWTIGTFGSSKPTIFLSFDHLFVDHLSVVCVRFSATQK